MKIKHKKCMQGWCFPNALLASALFQSMGIHCSQLTLSLAARAYNCAGIIPQVHAPVYFKP